MSALPTIAIDGNEYPLEIISGTVLDYKERSDTQVYGGSDRRGNIFVGSSVTIASDMWLREYQSGNELHGQYSVSMGARAGNIIHQIRLVGFCPEPLLVVA